MTNNPSSFFEVQFWGVRGSIPSPGPETVRYGGNTSCLEMRIADRHLIFDGGTGLRALGDYLCEQQAADMNLFFTHYHWDHIQGVPFFRPLFDRDRNIHIWGDVPASSDSLKEHFYDSILHVNSPVPSATPKANLKFSRLLPGQTMSLGEIEIETGHLNHPNGAMGYRISCGGQTAVYCTDTEHYSDRLDEDVLTLARDADLLIYDAMYTDDEYHNPKASKVGWGHSTWQEGVKVAEQAGVKKLVIFHHEPNHNDDTLDQIQVEVQKVFPNSILAREGMVLKLGE
ncbi:MBL fold metallo-hydrolase [Roseofilum casamattae]|uniref:MBL fold metallo-hydrolase n=1 Tax=Roseofilum casamattae BLCC-M143 TaxID=3022442 RepID=A0ABT7BZ56_9CYAN|nr:MBL fold metallo-hydrolase [Roseofilum casamattae]MDJ1184487.1 MBL fold metallo-hydrolase [Roseofilum casamattae BLCC-M143]